MVDFDYELNRRNANEWMNFFRIFVISCISTKGDDFFMSEVVFQVVCHPMVQFIFEFSSNSLSLWGGRLSVSESEKQEMLFRMKVSL